MEKYYTIPAGIAEIVLKENLFRDFQVYLALKKHCEGQIRINANVIEIVSKYLQISPKTVQRSLKVLKSKNWIGYSKRSKWFFVRGFDSLRKVEKIKQRRAYTLNVRFIRQLEILKAFLIACGYAEIINWIKGKQITEARKTYGASRFKAEQKVIKASPCPIALTYFSKVFNCSKATAHKYRKLAAKYNFIKYKHIATPFMDGKLIEGSLPNIRSMGPEIARRLIVVPNAKTGKKCLCIQLPDEITSRLDLRKRKTIFKKKVKK